MSHSGLTKTFAAAGAALVLGLLALAGPAGAAAASTIPAPGLAMDVSPPEFESFNAEYFLTRDEDGHSHLRVIETIVAVYPDYDYNKGFYRDIPKFYQEMPLNPTIVSVVDELDRPVPYAVESYETGDGLDFKYSSIAIGDESYLQGRKTYVIEYTLDNVVQRFGDQSRETTGANVDELYWDVNGVDTGIPIGQVGVTVHIPDELVENLTGDSACYSGTYSTIGCSLQQSSDGTTFTASVGDMASYDTLSIAIGFEKGTFTPGDRLRDSWIFSVLPPVLLGLSALALLIAILVRAFLWRDAKGRGIIIPQYSVPENHDMLVSADVIERGHEALAAAFVDLAVRGFVDVVDLAPERPEGEDRFGLSFRSREGATKEELAILTAIFSENRIGEVAELGSLSATEGAALFAMGLRARDRVVALGLRAKPAGIWDTVLKGVKWPILIAFGAVFLWTYNVGIDAGALFGWVLAAIGCFVVTSLLMIKPYLLTPKGAELRDYLLGMRMYLRLAEADRLKVLQSPDGALRVDTADRGVVVKLNEKLLPYAILWDIEQEWAGQLEVEYQAAAVQPTWINSDLNRMNFGRTLSSFTRSSISSVRPIVPVQTYSGGGGGGGGSSWSGGRSSFSSGSRGGGFSGGGGGGGGMRGR